MDSSLFDREKIYEKLEIRPRPENYRGRLPWTVQQQIAATNGIHFRDSVGFLSEYPVPPIPIGKAEESELFLDIGCGWGRWLVAASKKNYLAVGVDIRLEFCETGRFVLRDNGFSGYTVVGDLKNLPFLGNTFDVVWSFSVIQHTHKDRLLGCIAHVQRILKEDSGYCCLEFPNKNGIHNRFGPAKKYAKTARDYNSWDVRYYTPAQYKEIFSRYFDNFRYFNHSVLGIGVLPGDAKYAHGLKNKAGIWLSRGLSHLFELATPLKAFSDSIYIQCYKQGVGPAGAELHREKFRKAHVADPSNNLNIVHLLSCPATGGEVFLSGDGREVISEKARLAYPVKNDTPIMIAGEARSL
jgi:ubiquinone/menaquinone biosynthesis C-methylase UbiE/uncharacterized protein YbaR (Trm112 family)